MSAEDKIIAESIRSGKYFEDARAWYRAVYIGPVSERAFFLIVAVLAVIVAYSSCVAMLELFPLTERPAIPIRAGERPEDTSPRLVQLGNKGDSKDAALARFFISYYIQAYEGFSVQTYLSNAQFVHAQSSSTVYAAYLATNDVTNPSSPAVTLGENGKRDITIEAISFSLDNGTAKVRFLSELRGVEKPTKSEWTARLTFRYTGMKAETVKNPDTGLDELHTTDPQFQVVNYVLEQN